MSKKNTYILKTLILLCTTVASSFYVLSTPPGKRREGETSNRARQIPQRPAPMQPTSMPVQPALTPTPVLQPVEPQTQPIKKTPIAALAEQEELEESSFAKASADAFAEKPEEPAVATVSQSRKVQAPQPGWFTSTVLPIFLLTLDKAVGGGIAATTKSAIKLFGTRHTFINLKDDARKQAIEVVESGKFDQNILALANKTLLKYKISKDSPEYAELEKEINDEIARSKEEKINQQTKAFLSLQKIDADEMEKATSLSSIFSQAIYTGMLNTIIPMVGTLIGYGVTLSLQGLMPAQQQQ